MGDARDIAVWDAVRAGRHVLVAGEPPAPPPDWEVVDVDCAGPEPGGGALCAVIERVSERLGIAVAERGHVAARARGASGSLLGAEPAPPIEARFVALCNRLAGESLRPSTVLLRSVDAADPATAESLAAILARPSWLALPLVLQVDRIEGSGTLLEAVRSAGGEVVTTPAAAPAVPGPPWDWRVLPPPALRVMRAAAALGETIDVALLGAVLDSGEAAVLEALQSAVDLGAPLADGGDGHLSLPAETAADLRAATLPSLLASWRSRALELLPGSAAPARPAAAVPAEQAAESPAPANAGYAEVFEPARPGADEARETTAVGAEPSSTVAPATGLPRPAPGERGGAGDDIRAARIALDAGRVEEAAGRCLAAASRLSDEGDARRARQLVSRATELVEQVRSHRARGLLQARTHCVLARIRLNGVPGEAPSDLHGALDELDAADAALPGEVPAGLVAEIATLRAEVAYELGDPASLQAALQATTQSARTLLEAGASREAAGLLNEQAALELRLGDAVRAVQLLTRSRELFERLCRDAPDDPVVHGELAQTCHLLARTPLHARVRAGREAEAIEMALANAREAERLHGALGQPRALARTWESMARLEMARGASGAAIELLGRAIDEQKRLGDAAALARSVAAYADLLAGAGELERSLQALADSVALNARLGLPIGLAYNRAALERLRGALGDAPGAGREAFARVDEALREAEDTHGRMELPGH